MSRRPTIVEEFRDAQLTMRLAKDYDDGRLLPGERTVLEAIMVRYFSSLEFEPPPEERSPDVPNGRAQTS